MLPLPDVLQLTFFEALTLGAITSATDPVAALAVLKRSGASSYLSTVVAGESLINDGTALVLVKISTAVAYSCETSSVGGGIISFLKLAVGGCAVGACMGLLTFVCIYMVQTSHIEPIEASMFGVLLSLACAFCSFAFAEAIVGVSGVLSCMSAGLALNFLWRIDRKHGHLQQTLWEFLEYLFNVLLFSLAGVEVGRYDFEGPMRPYIGVALASGALIVLYTLLSRAVVLACLWPIIARTTDHLTWKDAIVMWWSGLRGAVGLLVAIEVAEKPFDTTTEEGLHQEERAEMILLFVSMLTVTTLVIFAPTISWLLRKLNMLDQTEVEHRRTTLLRALLNKTAAREEAGVVQSPRFSQVDRHTLHELTKSEDEKEKRSLFSRAYSGVLNGAEELMHMAIPGHEHSSASAKTEYAAETELSEGGRGGFRPPTRELSMPNIRATLGNMDDAAKMAMARGLYLRLLSACLSAHLDVERTTIANFSILSSLEKIVEESKVELESPLELWNELDRFIRKHHQLMSCRKWWHSKRDALYAILGITRATELQPNTAAHTSRTEVAVLAGFICVLDEAWEELTRLTSYQSAHDDSDVDLPMRSLHREIQSQIDLAQERLQNASHEQIVAVFTKEAAIAKLRKRGALLDAFAESGLWSESEASQNRHHIEHQMNHITDIKLLNRPGKKHALQARSPPSAVAAGGGAKAAERTSVAPRSSVPPRGSTGDQKAMLTGSVAGMRPSAYNGAI